MFPEGVNVEFAVRRGPRHVAMRVQERGSGETLSCGTGACAVMVAAARADGVNGEVTYQVDVPGGRLHVTQRVVPTGPWFEAMRSGSFDVVVEANCNSVVNPLLDVQKYLPRAVFSDNYGNYDDQLEIDLYQKMLHETDGAKYVYLPTLTREKARRSALKRMVQTFFDGSTELAVAALLSKAKLKQDELDRLSALIEQARKEGR